MIPEPGDQVLVVFTGTAEKAYQTRGHPDADLMPMVPVRLHGGELVYVPLAGGVAVLPGEMGALLPAAVNDGRELWEPEPFNADCQDCQAAIGDFCSMHQSEADRAGRYRRLLLALAAAGLEPGMAGA